tara:strand:+ start:5169 stop:6899 length:1731 start_codon:yes stop_codon:yes gene_type:complete
MKKLDLVQGTKEWLEARAKYFTASEAPAMMGAHKNISRTNLLDHKKGWTSIVDDYTLKLFERGHEAEEMARPIASQKIGEPLLPAVAIDDEKTYLASFDGITMFEDILFEHKLWNKTLAENVLNNVLEPHYYWQLEHQLLVSGAEKVFFVTSDGTENNWQSMYYESVPERREQLLKGWAQFSADLASHKPEAKAEKVKSESVRDLPAINYKMNGLALESNLNAYKQAAMDLVELSKAPLESDQDFANAEARQKVFTKAEKDIAAACDRVMGEIDSIDAFVKDMRFIAEQIRQARLAEGKQIKARKDEIRAEIMSQANADIIAAKNEAENKINANLPALSVNIANAMKGKRTIDSLKDAAAGEVARAKIEINEFVELAMGNALCLSTQAQGYDFLFNDWQQIAFKAVDDFKALVKSRIADHKEREAKREEEQRARIRAEEEAKAKREAEAKLRAEEAAKRKAEQERQAAEQAAKREQEMREQQAAATKTQAEAEQQQEVTANEAPEVESEPEAKPAQYLGHPNSKKPGTSKRKLSMMEINGIINFVSSITASEETPFSEELQRRADDYIQKHSSEAA